MSLQAFGERRTDDFTRLHKLFVEHLGIAVGLVWTAALVAAFHAPWLPNIRGLIDPLGRAESTWSFLFALPLLMLAGWVSAIFGVDAMRRIQLLKNQYVEFGVAASVALAVFYMAVDRAVTAFLLGF